MLSSKHTLLLLVVSALFLSWSLDTLNVTIMEARNFVSAREMVEEGNVLIPTLNGTYRLEKPPLPTWITAVFGSVFGFDKEWPLRMPAVFMGIMCIWFLVRIFRCLGADLKLALICGWILLTSFYFFFTARSGMWDIYCHAFMLGGIFYYMRLWMDDALKWRNALYFGLFIAASIMSKGPIAPYTLFLPFLFAFHFSMRYDTLPLGSVWKPLLTGVLLGLILGLTWPVYIFFSEAGQHALEVIAKESSNWISYEVKPFYYYWSFPVQSGFWGILGFSSLFFILYALIKGDIPVQAKVAILWTVAAVILLSLIPEKKSRYLLPTLFPLSMLIAVLVGQHLPGTFERIRKLILGINLWLLAILFVVLGLGIISGMDAYFEWKLHGFTSASILLLVFGTITLFQLIPGNYDKAFAILVAGFILIIMISLPSLSHQFNSREAVNSFAQFRSDPDLNGLDLYSDHVLRPEIVWALGRKAPRVANRMLPVDADTIGLFVEIEEPMIMTSFIHEDWEVIQNSVYNENPKNKDKQNRALTARFMLLASKRE